MRLSSERINDASIAGMLVGQSTKRQMSKAKKYDHQIEDVLKAEARRWLIDRCTSEAFWRGLLTGFAPQRCLFAGPDDEFISKLYYFDSVAEAWESVADCLNEAIEEAEEEVGEGPEKERRAAPNERGQDGWRRQHPN